MFFSYSQKKYYLDVFFTIYYKNGKMKLKASCSSSQKEPETETSRNQEPNQTDEQIRKKNGEVYIAKGE